MNRLGPLTPSIQLMALHSLVSSAKYNITILVYYYYGARGGARGGEASILTVLKENTQWAVPGLIAVNSKKFVNPFGNWPIQDSNLGGSWKKKV